MLCTAHYGHAANGRLMMAERPRRDQEPGASVPLQAHQRRRKLTMAQNYQGGRQGQSQNQGGSAGESASEVRQNLRGAQFPASRDDLRQKAEQNNADEDFLDSIDALPDRRFDSIDTVIAAIAEVTEAIGGARRSRRQGWPSRCAFRRLCPRQATP
jgi:hypothetical protein